MKYIVMECHFSYAVLLDENGKFLKAANRGYHVGQTVTDPVLVGDYRYRPPLYRIVIRLIGLLLFCLTLVFCVYKCSHSSDPAASVSQQTTQHASATDPAESIYISMEDAKAIALQNAGLSSDSVSFTEAKRDHDDGIIVYELEFIANGMEYEYEINAVNGEIISNHSEPAE